VNPFDLRAALLAKHAQHVVLIHFPVALFLAAVAFDFLARWSRRQTLVLAAYYNLTAAAVMSLPVVATGLLAWRWQLQGPPLSGLLLQHFVMALISTLLIWIVWWCHRRAARAPERAAPVWRLILEAVAALAVMLTAHLGGFLSGVNAPG
jgi:uncharacterized membrane protein